MSTIKSDAAPRVITIRWERLVLDGQTCPRCAGTGDQLENAVAHLRKALAPSGVAVAYEQTTIALRDFQKDPAVSNRVFVNGRLVEEWLGGATGASPCCDVCGDEECRTVEVAGATYEVVPADLIIKAGLLAAAALLPPPPRRGCCPAS